ncbi:lysine transporter LysE [Streptomyces sp. NPDC057101]|uniref:lysine transporter LysE n=1 Tax=Streptomyces sp. NPDC057101 TaxID=3346020 RepID=UPI00362B656C
MSRVRRVAKGIGEFLTETVGEAASELVLTVLACALLGGLVLLAYLSWSSSPRLTLAGAGLLSAVLAHGAWVRSRGPDRSRRGRRFTAVTGGAFSVAAATAAFLLVYATECDCL